MLLSIQAQYATLGISYGAIALGGQDSTLFLKAAPANFGAVIPYTLKNILYAPLVFPKDINGTLSACDSITADLKGKIAVINRSGCNTSNNTFVKKCYRAAQKGAVAVLIINDTEVLETMSLDANNALENIEATKITIPCLLISSKNGQLLRKNPPALPTFLLQLNHNPKDASPIKENKNYFTDKILYGGVGLDSLSANSSWYKFTAPQTGAFSVHSCNQNVNTHVGVFTFSNNKLQLKAENDNACAMNSSDPVGLAAALDSVFINKNETYYIAWDDRWSSENFWFDFKFKPDSTKISTKTTESITPKTNFKVAPNPTQGYTTLYYQSYNPNPYFVKINLVNSLGEILFSQSQLIENEGQISLDLSTIPQGLYFLQLQDKTRQTTQKIIIH
jgi:hypothetical protein